jgi:hypothetical protein
MNITLFLKDNRLSYINYDEINLYNYIYLKNKESHNDIKDFIKLFFNKSDDIKIIGKLDNKYKMDETITYDTIIDYKNKIWKINNELLDYDVEYKDFLLKNNFYNEDNEELNKNYDDNINLLNFIRKKTNNKELYKIIAKNLYLKYKSLDENKNKIKDEYKVFSVNTDEERIDEIYIIKKYEICMMDNYSRDYIFTCTQKYVDDDCSYYLSHDDDSYNIDFHLSCYSKDNKKDIKYMLLYIGEQIFKEEFIEQYEYLYQNDSDCDNTIEDGDKEESEEEYNDEMNSEDEIIKHMNDMLDILKL